MTAKTGLFAVTAAAAIVTFAAGWAVSVTAGPHRPRGLGPDRALEIMSRAQSCRSRLPNYRSFSIEQTGLPHEHHERVRVVCTGKCVCCRANRTSRASVKSGPDWP